MMKPVIRYWGRKAGSIAETYIRKYSTPGEIVLDPFGGAGSIIKTALLMGRRGIYSDLNPLAVLIARVEIEGVDPKDLTLASNELFRRQRLYYLDTFGTRRWMKCSYPYMVDCKCGTKQQTLYFLWHGNTVTATKVNCEACGYPLMKASINSTIQTMRPIYEFPTASLWYADGKSFEKRRQVNTVAELFTQRNLLILSALLRDIRELKVDERTRRALLLAFASVLYQASKMSRSMGGTWGVNSYWVPKMHVERNPYILFRNALRRLTHLTGLAKAYTSALPVINGNASVAILNCDAKKLPLPDNSVNLAITDPPFTDEIQYFELSYMAASWLGLSLRFCDEIIVNRMQGKDFRNYCRLLSKSFEELHRVLKHGRAAVIMLHNENEQTLRELVDLVSGAGFKINSMAVEKMAQRNVGSRDSIKGKDLLILICRKL